MAEKYVKPADPKVLVRRPERDGAHLPEEGAQVPWNSYWMRRVKDGSVVPAKPPRAAKTGGKEE